MHTCYFFFSEINKINRNYFDFRFNRIRSKLCTKPNYGNGDLSGIRFSLHANETWVARLTFILSSCLRLGTASLGTNMIFICHQHGKLSRQLVEHYCLHVLLLNTCPHVFVITKIFSEITFFDEMHKNNTCSTLIFIA